MSQFHNITLKGEGEMVSENVKLLIFLSVVNSFYLKIVISVGPKYGVMKY